MSLFEFFNFAVYILLLPEYFKPTFQPRNIIFYLSDSDGTWTHDPEIKSFVLYQLSYGIIVFNYNANVR